MAKDKNDSGKKAGLADLAKVVGQICKLLEPMDQEQRQKALDTVKALLTSRPVELPPRLERPPQMPWGNPQFSMPQPRSARIS